MAIYDSDCTICSVTFLLGMENYYNLDYFCLCGLNERDTDDLARGIKYCIDHSIELGDAAALSAQRFSYLSMQPIYTAFVKDLYYNKII